MGWQRLGRAGTVVCALLLFVTSTAWAAGAIHVWEKQELTFHSAATFANPYTDATVWVDLEGPGFKQRVYGFWDGGNTFRVRLVATAPGQWRWTSGSTPADAGLAGSTGSFTAIDWTEQEKRENPLRHGFLRATANNHALEFADGTPFFAVGDTWYSAATNRFKWYDDDRERPIGPEAGFKDYVRFRKTQGYNWVSIIAAFPNWDNDGQPWRIVDEATHLTVRSAWLEFGTGPDARTGTAKNMKNEGGRPFLFPGKARGHENVFPDMDRINPEYFKYFDRKVDYLNANGFIAFIESFRRDASELWMKYHTWPDSPARYMEYIRARYGANQIVFSPVHLDIIAESITVPQFNAAIRKMQETYGPPPFGTLMSANANPSTLTNWGPDSWVTLHTTGNKREHEYYWYLTEIFREPNTRPALNGEPYYSGYVDARGLSGGYKYGAVGGSEQDAQFVRSAMYGNVLSGGLAGHVYGAEGIWGADIEAAAPTHMWDAFQWASGANMTHLPRFIASEGVRYRDLVPDDYVVPSRTPNTKAYEGWAYAARTPGRDFFLAYFEKGCPRSRIRGATPEATYRARWFDPRTGDWADVGNGRIAANNIGEITLPDFPGNQDWALSLVRAEAAAQLRPQPPVRDPNTPGYVRAKELPDGAVPAVDAIGNFIIGPTHDAAPGMSAEHGLSEGTICELTMSSAESRIYPGIARDGGTLGTVDPTDPAKLVVTTSHPAPWTRRIAVYVPRQYVRGTVAPFMVGADGSDQALFTALDSLIPAGRLPVMVAISIANGGGDAQGSERGLEYDTMSGRYAEFVENEVLPRVERQCGVTLTRDPDARATMGCSSGAAAALIMAWYHPDLYHRVLSYSGTFVNQQWPPSSETPHGAWEFHERLIAASPPKPLRIWLEVGDRDLLNPNVMRDNMHDWVLANENMARVLADKRYEYQFVFARSAGHCDRAVKQQTLPEALEWLWRTYPRDRRGPADPARLDQPPPRLRRSAGALRAKAEGRAYERAALTSRRNRGTFTNGSYGCPRATRVSIGRYPR